MKKYVNIFICHTPFHGFISRQICASMFRSGGENVIISSTALPVERNLWTSITIPSGIWGRIVGYWRAKMLISKHVRQLGENVEIFLPHIHGILGNYIFNSRLVRQRNSKISFYYEGVAMVDMHRSERALNRAVLQRKLLSLTILHRFVNYPDILPVDSSRIYKIYTPYPEKTIAPDSKKVRVVFPRAKILTGSNGVLVVGIDAGDALHEATSGLVRFLKTYTAGMIYFKPHYADRLHVFEDTAAREQLSFTNVQDARCIEEIIGELPVAHIICTHFSSALLNLKLIYQDELKVLFLAHPAALAVLGDEYIKMIHWTGVEIIDLKQ